MSSPRSNPVNGSSPKTSPATQQTPPPVHRLSNTALKKLSITGLSLQQSSPDYSALETLPKTPSNLSSSSSASAPSTPTKNPAQQNAIKQKPDPEQAKRDAKKQERERKKMEARRVQEEAVKTLRDQLTLGRLTICVGSGVTLYSAPSQSQRLSWWGLMSNALDYFEDQASTLSQQPMNKADLAAARRILNSSNATEADREDVANRIQKLLGNRIDLETTWLRSQFKNLYKNYVDQPEILDSIRALSERGALLFTTNYDDLLERHCKLDPIDGSDASGLMSWRRGARQGVFHPHGYWRNASHIVLSAEKYWRGKNDEVVQETLQHVLASNTVLFVGCGGGLSDPNFGPLIHWVGQKNIGTTASHYILLQAAETNPVTELPLIHLRCANSDDIARFLNDLLEPIERREGLISEIPNHHERKRIHDWLAPLDQSQFLNDMTNLQGPNRFDRQVTHSQDVWDLNKPSRVRLQGEEGWGKTMFCTSVIQNTLGNCRKSSLRRSRDSLAYFYCATYNPYLENPGVRRHDFNQFLRTAISQLSPPNVVPAPLRDLYTSCTRFHPARLPTNVELQVVLFQILWLLDQPPAPKRGSAPAPGETYMIIDELDSLTARMRDEFGRFFRILSSQKFEHFHLLITANSMVTVGGDPPPRPTTPKIKGKKKKPMAVHNPFSHMPLTPGVNPTNWHTVTLDRTTTGSAMLEWVRDRFTNDGSLLCYKSIRHELALQIYNFGENFRWVFWKLGQLGDAGDQASLLDDQALKDLANSILNDPDSEGVSSDNDEERTGRNDPADNGSYYDPTDDTVGAFDPDDDDDDILPGGKRPKQQKDSNKRKKPKYTW
ncbi:hypothetical protein NUW58_g176 [Xylaria curta]|uniref:Uncharacterized protein n=1 Tax=Xylaria curta TaxID=42375 RepID=A0ACC1PRC4_9PEZI|nr:hypothetical protein NUW58_g176 [Xylaria curta]